MKQSPCYHRSSTQLSAVLGQMRCGVLTAFAPRKAHVKIMSRITHLISRMPTGPLNLWKYINNWLLSRYARNSIPSEYLPPHINRQLWPARHAWPCPVKELYVATTVPERFAGRDCPLGRGRGTLTALLAVGINVYSSPRIATISSRAAFINRK